MDSRKNKYRTNILLLIITFLLFTNFSICQNNFEEAVEIPTKAIENYIAGIQSENVGLKKSCIYFAGKYLLQDASPCLIEEFKKADDETIAVIIAWSLYRIGDQDCLESLNNIAMNHRSNFLKNFCKSLNNLRSYEQELYFDY